MKEREKVNEKSIKLILSFFWGLLLLINTICVQGATLEKDNFFEELYSGKYQILVEDKKGNDVTNIFIKETRKNYESNNINIIKKIMADYELKAHVYKVQNPSGTMYAVEQYKNVSDFFVEYYKDKKYSTVMEFKASLSGGIWYNPNTQQVTRTSKPTFKIEHMNVPLGISPFCNGIQTGSNVSNGKGYFWASYTCSGQAFANGLTIVYDYGRHTSSFYGRP